MSRAKLSLLTAAIVLVLAIALSATANYFSFGLFVVGVVWLVIALRHYLKGAGEVADPSARLGGRLSRILLFWS